MRLAALLLAATASPWATGQPMPSILAFGDSLTDEYFEDGYGYAMSWYQQLQVARGMNAGPRGSWNEPRRNGHALNWARFGANSTDTLGFVRDNQPELAALVRRHSIRLATVFIGNNDFAPWRDAYGPIYDGQPRSEYQWRIDLIEENVRKTVRSLQRLGVQVVLAGFLDLGNLPWTRGIFVDPEGRTRVAAAVAAANERLRAVALETSVPFVDMHRFGLAVYGTAYKPVERIVVGGNTVTTLTSGEAPTHGFVQDGIHPHTVVQSLKANLFLTALNLGYGARVPLLPERQICALAGLPYQRDTFRMDYRSLVVVPRRSPLAP